MSRLIRVVVCALFLAGTGQAQNLDQVSSGELWIGGDEQWAIAPVLSQQVEMTISGIVITTKVRQRFINDSAQPVEAVYAFPLPDTAAVNGFRLRIGERVIVGEIREKQQAERIYSRAREEGRSASLMKQHRANLFTTRTANIPPGEHIDVEFQYLDTVSYSDGLFSLRYPLAVTPRFGISDSDVQLPGYQAAAPISLKATVFMPGKPDLIESRYHDVNIVPLGPAWEVTMESSDTQHDFELIWMPRLEHQPKAEVFTETVGDETFVLMMMMPPQPVASQALPRDVIFVIDTSGSMHGDSIEQATEALLDGLSRLRRGDRFNVIEFNSDAWALFPEPQPVNAHTRNEAETYISELLADGGTEMKVALDLALTQQGDSGQRLRQVIFITDGAVGNELELFQQIQADIGDARLFTVGIGGAPNDWFMRKAAQFGRGTTLRVGDVAETAEKLEGLFARLESPALKDLCVQWPAAAESYPQRIPDLYLAEPLVVVARLQNQVDDVEVCGKSLNTNFSQLLTMDKRMNHPGVATLWARRKIESLMDSLVEGADTARVQKDVTQLALDNHLVSRWTSFVAVDSQPLQLSNPKLLRSVPQTATPAALLMLAGAVVIGLALWMLLSVPGIRQKGRGGFRLPGEVDAS
ncbi:MAG: marine proteobacterial sortase target protein [Lysobacteraceae bacterium]|nr:MAG: marine proteobacterial sortase target protein [Xanthomonadaceae bacterium]